MCTLLSLSLSLSLWLSLSLALSLSGSLLNVSSVDFLFLSQNVNWSDYATFAHDAVWAYALALDKLIGNYPRSLETIDSRKTSM